jgi:hypothetical protein
MLRRGFISTYAIDGSEGVSLSVHSFHVKKSSSKTCVRAPYAGMLRVEAVVFDMTCECEGNPHFLVTTISALHGKIDFPLLSSPATIFSSPAHLPGSIDDLRQMTRRFFSSMPWLFVPRFTRLRSFIYIHVTLSRTSCPSLFRQRRGRSIAFPSALCFRHRHAYRVTEPGPSQHAPRATRTYLSTLRPPRHHTTPSSDLSLRC